MRIKLIATDIDGTLLKSDRSISEKSKKILKRFVDKGGKVVLSTGRAFFATEKIAKELEIEGIIITYNGARVYDLERKTVISHKPVEGRYISKLIEVSRKHGIQLNLYQGDDWYVESKEREEVIHYETACGKAPVEKSFDEFENYEMTKALFIASPNILREIEAELREEMDDDVHITYSKSTYLEILNKKVNKGAALREVAKYYGISEGDIAAFGDELNDKEMLEFAGYGVAMKNANPELKKYVNYETATNDEDGVVEFILNMIPELI